MTRVEAAPYPQADPDGWQVTIGTIAVPETLCKVTLVGLTTAVDLDKAKAKGRNLGTIKYQGEDFGTFNIELESWDREGWRVVVAICVMAKKQKGQPLAVHHPMLDLAEIKSLIVEEIKWPGNDSTVQQRATLKCIQWAPSPPKAKPVTKTATKVAVPDALTLHKQGKKDFSLASAAKPTPPSAAMPPSVPAWAKLAPKKF